eukprot:SAG31_NODE_13945_length_836_cov_0.659430_1_plen_23_part_10
MKFPDTEIGYCKAIKAKNYCIRW